MQKTKKQEQRSERGKEVENRRGNQDSDRNVPADPRGPQSSRTSQDESKNTSRTHPGGHRRSRRTERRKAEEQEHRGTFWKVSKHLDSNTKRSEHMVVVEWWSVKNLLSLKIQKSDFEVEVSWWERWLLVPKTLKTTDQKVLILKRSLMQQKGAVHPRSQSNIHDLLSFVLLRQQKLWYLQIQEAAR